MNSPRTIYSRQPALNLTRRTIYIPTNRAGVINQRALNTVARHICAGDLLEASSVVEELSDEALRAPAHACLNALRVAVIANVLHDLAHNLWEFTADAEGLFAVAPGWDVDATAPPNDFRYRARASVAHARRARLKEPAVQQLLERVERGPRAVGGVHNLLGESARIERALRACGAAAIMPYLQLARPCDGEDPLTGLRLFDCFRYLRYSWSFPWSDPPGRRVPFLIRDAGQPHEPICGLLCLSSPTPLAPARDAAFGWSNSWLEAMARALSALRDEAPAAALQELARALRSRAKDPSTPTPAQITDDLCALMGVTPRHQLHLLAKLKHRAALAATAATRLIGGLLDHVSSERDLLSAATPAPSDSKLAQKRAAKLADLNDAVDALAPIFELLTRGDTLNASAAFLGAVGGGSHTFSGGARCARGLVVALREHKVAAIASTTAEVSLCGAIAPYQPLLLGKLVSLLALSDEVRHVWGELYRDQASVTQSHTVGEDYVRSSSLDGLVTTSYYAVNSAIYNRAWLPQELGSVGWKRVGKTAGYGTLHFTPQTTRLLELLFARDGDLAPIAAGFAGGHSKRMRKLQRGLTALGLPADALLAHGMRRNVYVCRLNNRCLPGGDSTPRPAPLAGIVEHWRERWLTPRLPTAIEALSRCRDMAPLSQVIRDQRAREDRYEL